MDVKEADILGDTINTHWYYRSKALAVTRLLGERNISTILDVGAGSGFFSRRLLAQSAAREAWCVDVSYENDSDATEAAKPVYFRKSIDTVKADLVLLMDVLEHVDDDVGLLTDYMNKVPEGALFLVSVPAFKSLWSGHDVFLEHKRRYRLKEIENVVERAGLSIIQGAYFFGAVFPIAGTIRIVSNLFWDAARKPSSQLKQHNPLINEILSALCKVELPLIRYNRFAGLTAFCLAKHG